MLKTDTLQAFVAVAETGGFTRAGERICRTQSSVSQQIRKLELQVGRRLMDRDRTGNVVVLTHAGETLLDYARRILELVGQAEEEVRSPETREIVKVGVPEDFGGARLASLLATFADRTQHIRLDVRSGWSAMLLAELEAGELDLALVKQDPGRRSRIAYAAEELAWVGNDTLDPTAKILPLALFPKICTYRAYTIAALESCNRRWRVAFESQGLAGVQAAVSAGLGFSVLSRDAVLPDLHTLLPSCLLPALPCSELALLTSPGRKRPSWDQVIDHVVAQTGLVLA